MKSAEPIFLTAAAFGEVSLLCAHCTQTQMHHEGSPLLSMGFADFHPEEIIKNEGQREKPEVDCP